MSDVFEVVMIVVVGFGVLVVLVLVGIDVGV